MNGIPMKLDYSKTLNDQHETFEYYKNRYISYELQIIQLNKRIAYLERSIERKDDTIIELRNSNGYNKEFDIYLCKLWNDIYFDEDTTLDMLYQIQDIIHTYYRLTGGNDETNNNN